jgi:multisubunit Na+/H+ antiporter MnhF subunit
MTIDIWFIAAICLFVLACCAALRILSTHSLPDRLLAANVAATLGCAGALSLTVSFGDLVVAVLALIVACIVFATTIRVAEGMAGDAP